MILSVDGTTVSIRQAFLSYLLLHTSPGATVRQVIHRDGERRTVRANLAVRV